MSTIKSLAEAWFCATHKHRLATLAIAVVLVVEGVIAVGYRVNDFEWHRRLGQHFLDGNPYLEGGQWYPLGRAMVDALPAAMNKYVARGLVYSLSVAALIAAAFRWNSMAGTSAVSCRAGWTAALITFAVGIALIQRDLDECGLQILLLFMLTSAGLALSRRRAGWAGFWLAAAVSYKSTPILFLPYLLWRRQWRAAGWMTTLVVAWNIAPCAYLGWTKMLEGNRQYFVQAHKISQLHDPSQNGVEPPKPQNQSVLAASARYLMRFDAEHGAYLDHPGYVQFGGLSAHNADRAIKVGLLVAAALLAWRFRPSRKSLESDERQTSDFACQWAALCALCALLAPLCWKQHLVLTLPCLFLSLRAVLTRQDHSRWRLFVLCVIGVLMLGTGRELLGRSLSHLLSAYKVHTLAAVLSLVLVLTMPVLSVAAAIPVPKWRKQRLPFGLGQGNPTAVGAAFTARVSPMEKEPARR